MSDPNERGAVDELDARTPLDRTIDRIGMGASEQPKKPVYDRKVRRTASRSPPILKARTNGLCYPYVASVRYLRPPTQIIYERIDPRMCGVVRLDGRQRTSHPSISHCPSTHHRGH